MDCYSCKNMDIAPVPMEGEWAFLGNISQINGTSHGVGGCPPHQGACKLTLNVKKGIIQEALIETVGCSGITQSAVIASEILVGKNLIEALNTHLVCDAINVAMKNAFYQFIYGRTQTAFSKGGLPVGSLCDELADGSISHVGTVDCINGVPPRILETTEGYTTRVALDAENNIIGYEFLKIGKMLDDISHENFTNVSEYIGTYGRFSEGVIYKDVRRLK